MDYGVMVLADRRFARVDKRTKLPQWIQQYLAPSELNLSTEGAAHLASMFLREMAQPVEKVSPPPLLFPFLFLP